MNKQFFKAVALSVTLLLARRYFNENRLGPWAVSERLSRME